MVKTKLVPLAAIAGIVTLDAIALFQGIDGALLMTSLAAIAGIGGYHLGRPAGEAIKAIKGKVRELGLVLVSAGALVAASCSALEGVEVCYVHPEFGQVCVMYDGKLHIRADLTPEQRKAVEDWIRDKVPKR